MSGDGTRRTHHRRQLNSASVGLCVLLGTIGVLFLLPLYVVIVTAFKPLNEVVEGSMLMPPAHWTMAPLYQAWSSACIGAACNGLADGVRNSIVITAPAVCVSVMFGAVNGYALTKWRIPGAHVMFGLLLVSNFMPYQIMLIPMAITLRELDLFGAVKGLILVHVIYGMPYMTLLFRNFYMSVPDDLIRAARMDGGHFWSIFFHVILPLSPPMLSIALILQFTGVWNDYLFGLVFGGRNVPVTVMLDNLINSPLGGKEYNVNMAGVLITVLPALVIYLLAGRWFFRGLAVGAANK